jgi:hypothetical protein
MSEEKMAVKGAKQSFLQLTGDRPEQLHRRLDVGVELLRQHVGFREAVGVLHASLFESEDIEVEIVPLCKFLLREAAPAPLGFVSLQVAFRSWRFSGW